jgi:hypothetical protein
VDAHDRLDRPVAARHGWQAGLLLLAHNPAGSIYGTVLADSVLAVEAERQTTLRDLIYAELVTVLIYWLAHVYAEFLGSQQGVGRRGWPRRLAETMSHEWSLVTASFVPLLAVLLASAVGASVQTASLADMWTGVGSLILWGEIAGRQSGSGTWASLAYGLVSGAFGVALILLRVLLLH